MHACVSATSRAAEDGECVCSCVLEVGPGSSSESSTATLANEAGVTGDADYMHACNHTKKFISYKSHFAMDAKYLIMANTVMPALDAKVRRGKAGFPQQSINDDDGEAIWKQQIND